MIRVGLIGLGRTGSIIARELARSPEHTIVMAIVSTHSEKAGRDLGEVLGMGQLQVEVKAAHRLETELVSAQPDVVVDFSSADACLKHMPVVAQHEIPLVIGTTGFENKQLQRMNLISNTYRIPIIYAPNMSLGINVLMNIVVRAAEILSNWDIEIVETHHRYKKDSPSGTALKIGKLLAESLERSEADLIYQHDRAGERTDNSIAIHAIRGGGVIGVHSVSFFSENEKLEIRHESLTRNAFVDCLKKLIAFSQMALPGYYTVEQVLGLVPRKNEINTKENQEEIA